MRERICLFPLGEGLWKLPPVFPHPSSKPSLRAAFESAFPQGTALVHTGKKKTVTYVTARLQYFKYRLSFSSARFNVRQTVLLFTPRSSAIWVRVCS